MGVYHLFHQCCQNHWDHVVSDDLVHWRRLPSPVRPSSNPKEWYDARGSYDGSLVVPVPINQQRDPASSTACAAATRFGSQAISDY